MGAASRVTAKNEEGKARNGRWKKQSLFSYRAIQLTSDATGPEAWMYDARTRIMHACASRRAELMLISPLR